MAPRRGRAPRRPRRAAAASAGASAAAAGAAAGAWLAASALAAFAGGAGHGGVRRAGLLLRRAELRAADVDQRGDDLPIGSPEYWDLRYRRRESFGKAAHIDDRGMGWYCEYQGPLQQTLQAVAGGRRDARVLNVGCGVDRLAADIYFDGFTNLISTDIAPSAIEEMKATSRLSMPDAEWMVDDMTNMTVPSASADIVVDKGAFDALMLGPSLFTSAAKVLREVQRVLKVGGTYIMVTHGQGNAKETRVPLLQLPHLSFNIQVTPDMGGFFLLVCTKLSELPEAEAAARWAEVEGWAAGRDREDNALEVSSMSGVASAPPAPAPAPAPAVPAPAPAPAAPAARASAPAAGAGSTPFSPRRAAAPVAAAPAPPAAAAGEAAAEAEARRLAEREAEWDRIDEIGQ